MADRASGRCGKPLLSLFPVGLKRRPGRYVIQNIAKEIWLVVCRFHLFYGEVDQITDFVGTVGAQELGGAHLFLVSEGVLLVSKELMEVGHKLQGLRVNRVPHLLSMRWLVRSTKIELRIVFKKTAARIEADLKAGLLGACGYLIA